jgi:hypothetical protein
MSSSDEDSKIDLLVRTRNTATIRSAKPFKKDRTRQCMSFPAGPDFSSL